MFKLLSQFIDSPLNIFLVTKLTNPPPHMQKDFVPRISRMKSNEKQKQTKRVFLDEIPREKTNVKSPTAHREFLHFLFEQKISSSSMKIE